MHEVIMTNHFPKFNVIASSESEVVIQLQDCQQINSSTDVVENAPPVHNKTSYEHTEALRTSTEKKKIKSPAVPPKTYLDPKMDTNGEIKTPSDEEAQKCG